MIVSYKFINTILFFSIFLSTTIFITSCNSTQKVDDSPSIENSPLTNSYWKLISLHDSLIHPTMEKTIFLKFEDSSRVSGFAGCNGTGGKYVLGKNNHIIISEMVSTKMACPDLNIENAFFKALDQSNSYRINADTLVLFNTGKKPVSKFISVADVGQWK